MDSMFFPKKKHVFYHDLHNISDIWFGGAEIQTTNGQQENIYSYEYSDRLEVKYVIGDSVGEVRLLFSIPNANLADMTKSFDVGDIEEYEIIVIYTEPLDTTLILYNIDISSIEVITVNVYSLDFSTTGLYIDGMFYQNEFKIDVIDGTSDGEHSCIVEIVSETDITRSNLSNILLNVPDGSYFLALTTNEDSTSIQDATINCGSGTVLSQSDITRYYHRSELDEFYSPFYETITKAYSKSFTIDYTSTLNRNDGLIAQFTFGTEEFNLFKNKSIKFDCTANVSTQLYIYDYEDNLIYSSTDSSFTDDVYFSNSFVKTSPATFKIYSPDLIDPDQDDYNINFDLTIFPCISERYVSGSITDFVRIIYITPEGETITPIEDVERIFFSGISQDNIEGYIFGGLGGDDIKVAGGLGIDGEDIDTRNFGGIY